VLAGLRRGWHLLRRYVLPRTGRVGSDAAGDEAPLARDVRGVPPGAGATTAGTPTSAAPPLDERAIDLPSHDEPLASATPKSSPPAEPFVESLLLECLSTFPYVRVTVTGACMRPALAEGERVHLAGRGARTPRLGDVVLARHPDGLRLHRLVWGPPLAPAGRPWRTMADRARLLDPRLDPADVLGTVVAVEDRPDARPRRPARALLSLGCAVLARVRAGARPEPAGAAS
jgi:hypothetical protein